MLRNGTAYLETRPAIAPALTTCSLEPFSGEKLVFDQGVGGRGSTNFIFEMLSAPRHAIDAIVRYGDSLLFRWKILNGAVQREGAVDKLPERKVEASEALSVR